METLKDKLEIAEIQSKINAKQAARQQAIYMAEKLGKSQDAGIIIEEAQVIYEWLIKDL